MLLDYYLASQFGGLWFRLHPALKVRIGDGPGLCRQAATDRQIPAVDLLRAQVFAKAVWWRAGMALFVPFIAAGVCLAAVHNVRIAADVGIAFMLAVLAMMVICMAQMMMLFIRSNLTAGYLRRGDTEPLDAFQGGYPTRYDFWIAAGIAVAITAFFSYASGLVR